MFSMFQCYSHHICGSKTVERLFAYNACTFELHSLKMLKNYSFDGASPENPKPTADTQCEEIKKKKKDRPILSQEIIPE